jgi:uncharacterized protein (DUF2141 family)
MTAMFRDWVVTSLRWGVWLACGWMLFVLAPAGAQQDEATARYTANAPGKTLCTLKVHVTGFRNDNGRAGGNVFATPDGWPENNNKAIVHGGFPISGHQAMEVFQVPAGRYGIVVIHDENGNHKLDRNLFGYPKEGFGFANNPKIGLSAASFKDASVNVGCPETQVEIQLIYK